MILANHAWTRVDLLLNPSFPLDSTASIWVKLTWQLSDRIILVDYLKYPFRFFKLLPCPNRGGIDVVEHKAHRSGRRRRESRRRSADPIESRNSTPGSGSVHGRFRRIFQLAPPWLPLLRLLRRVTGQERLRSWSFPSDSLQMNVNFREKSHLRCLLF